MNRTQNRRMEQVVSPALKDLERKFGQACYFIHLERKATKLRGAVGCLVIVLLEMNMSWVGTRQKKQCTRFLS